MRHAALILVICSLGFASCSAGRGENAGGRGGAAGNGSGAGSQTLQPAATPSPKPTQDPLPVVQKLTTDLGAALAQGNAEQLEALLSDGYLHVNDNGQMLTKVDIISAIRQGSVKFNSVNIEEVNVRVYGEAAVVTANFIGNSSATGGRTDVQDRVTLVAAREGDTWRFVSGQSTPIHTVPQNGNSKTGASGGTPSGGTSGGTTGATTGSRGFTSGSTQQSGSNGPTQ